MLLKLCQQIWLCLINRLFRWSLTHYKLPKGKHSASYLFSTLSSSLQIVMRLLLGGKVMTKLDSILKSRDIALSTKVRLVKATVFPVFMCGCESWTIKKVESQRIDAFELWCWRRKTLESPLDCKEIQPVHPKGDQSWVFIGRTDVEAETPILWPPDAKT